MVFIRNLSWPAAVILAVVMLASCAIMEREPRIGIKSGRLTACPSSPNCVCSDAEDPAHRIDPFVLAAKPETAWAALREEIAARPRTRIVKAADDYLHVEEKSRFFGFVDDIEFHLRPADQIIAVRSASRVGYSDLGVNRKRVESIRKRLQERGFLQ